MSSGQSVLSAGTFSVDFRERVPEMLPSSIRFSEGYVLTDVCVDAHLLRHGERSVSKGRREVFVLQKCMLSREEAFETPVCAEDDAGRSFFLSLSPSLAAVGCPW